MPLWRSSSGPVGVSLLAAVYCLAGRAGLLLAIPPGFATAVWPPSGIALAALLLGGPRLWPGVLLGSFLVNASMSLDLTSGETALRSMVPAALIAGGAAIQALVGWALLVRKPGYPNDLVNSKDIGLLLLLGGPVACVVGASVGTTVLSFAGLVEPSRIAFTWWTWWAGDTIGVLVFTPVLLLLFDHRLAGGPSRRRRVAVPLMAAFAAVVGLFVFASAAENAVLRTDFEHRAELVARNLEEDLEDYLVALQALERLFASSSEVSEDEFSRFSRFVLGRFPAFTALEWAPRVPAAERVAFERAGPRILQRDAQGRLVPAQPREVYYPVRYVQPMESNRLVLGFDLASDGTRRAALESSTRAGSAVATAPLRLLQARGRGFLLFLPVSTGEGVQGMVLGAFEFSRLMDPLLRSPEARGMEVALYDVDAGRGGVFFDSSRVGPHPFQKTFVLNRAGREWKAVFLARPGVGPPPLQAWTVLTCGLLFIGALGAFLLVVTGQVASTERTVEERTADLRRLAHRTQMILDAAGDGIYGVDLQGRVTFANPAAARLLEVPVERLLQQEIHPLVHPPGACEPDTCLLHRCLVDGESHGEDVARFHSGSGRDLPVEYVSAPIREGEAVLGGVVVFKDVSERQAVNRLKDEFVSVVSHELRTPLTAIRGALGLLVAGKAGDLPPGMLRMLELAGRNAERLTLLVNGILEFEALESGHAPLDLEVASLEDLVNRSVEMNLPLAQQAGVRLVGRSEVGFVRADPHRVLQILTNLISNAVKFSEADREVSVEASVDTGEAVFRVRDRGRGIPAGKLEQIFERFHQVDSSDTREKGGTGLGLAISRKIVALQGGRIWVESRLGEGSVFSFTLPRAEAPEESGRVT